MFYFEYIKQSYYQNKLRYQQLKQIGGENNGNDKADVLYHGTSMFYIDYIKRDGITGRYPDDIFNKMQEYWPTVREAVSYPRSTYVNMFINRQKRIREFGMIDIDFTPQKSVGEEYAGGERIIGEGPTFFSYMLSDYVNLPESKDNPSYEEMFEFSKLLEKAQRYPPILLAIKVAENPEIDDVYQAEWSHSVDFVVRPKKLYIVNDKGNLIQLLSDEGEAYIREKIIEFEKNEDKRRKLEEYLALHGKEWEEKIDTSQVRKYYILRTIDGTHSIEALLDTLKGYEYFSIRVIIPSDNGYKYNIYIVFTEKGEIKINFDTGLNLLKSDIETKSKLYEAINKILPLIDEDIWKEHIKKWLRESLNFNNE